MICAELNSAVNQNYTFLICAELNCAIGKICAKLVSAMEKEVNISPVPLHDTLGFSHKRVHLPTIYPIVGPQIDFCCQRWFKTVTNFFPNILDILLTFLEFFLRGEPFDLKRIIFIPFYPVLGNLLKNLKTSIASHTKVTS